MRARVVELVQVFEMDRQQLGAEHLYAFKWFDPRTLPMAEIGARTDTRPAAFAYFKNLLRVPVPRAALRMIVNSYVDAVFVAKAFD